MLFAAYMFSLEREKLIAWYEKCIPGFVKHKINVFMKNSVGVLVSYCLAQLKIMIVIIAILWIGFFIAGIGHSFIYSVLVGIVDIFPILGTGTVIIPWAIFKLITGDIKNIAESYSDDADKVRDDQVVVMEAVQPALMITKKVDKTTYKVGDICEYQLVVTQTIKDVIAKNIVIEDQLSRNGAKVIKNSIKIYAPDGSDITRQCTITAGENKYVIETGKNLSYDESIKVSYQVKLKEASLSGKTLKNTATGKADFVKPVSAVRLVKIKKESKSTVTTGNKADRSNTSEYKRSPGTRDAASTPKTGDSFYEKWIFALLAASLGGSFIYWKKKKKH